MSYLVLKLLSGGRSASKIKLQVSNQPISVEALQYVLETEAIELLFYSDRELESVNVLLDVVRYELNFKELEGKYFVYVLTPKKRTGGYYECMFFNYFGLASLSILIDDGKDITTLFVEQFDVKAKKLRCEQVRQMLNCILSDKTFEIKENFSATSLKSNISPGNLKPSRAISDIEECVHQIEELLPHVVHNPITRVSSKYSVTSGNNVRDIDDQTVAWLCENASVLSEVPSLNEATLVYEGKYLSAQELQCTNLIECTDIYENQLLHLFVSNLIKRCREIQKESEKYRFKTTKYSEAPEEGYESFYKIMSSLSGIEQDVNFDRVQSILHNLKRIRDVLSRKLPVSLLKPLTPIITEKVKENKYYLALFLLMIRWFSPQKIDWSYHKLLNNIKDVPKLFEYYCLVRLKGALKELCSNESKIGPHSWRYIIENSIYILHYEPKYFLYGHPASRQQTIHNTELKKISRVKNQSSMRYTRFDLRTPDFSIEEYNGDNLKNLFIFDAKYTDKKLAFNRDLPECTYKYCHGLQSADSKGMTVQSMILLSPDEASDYYDMHIAPFDLFGDNPQKPAVGVQTLQVSSSKNVDTSILDIIKALKRNSL